MNNTVINVQILNRLVIFNDNYIANLFIIRLITVYDN